MEKELICRAQYEKETAEARERRLKWFKEARFGMFIHYSLFSQHGTGEWCMSQQNYTKEEYEQYAKTFAPKEGCADEWCRLAKEMGAKYAVLTTRHHEGFSLWKSEVNPYNAYNYCGRDIVREFVDACHKYDLKVGFYSSLMDWHHPDGWRCAFDPEARRRFLDYIEALNVELLSNYGKIDILWYDMPYPMGSSEGWDSINRNNRLRKLQPDMLINNRSKLQEDFLTPEESISPADGAYWEACMTFNRISWGYLDTKQVLPYTYTPQQIISMINTCASTGGNLLLNIGPMPDGTVPPEAVEPLHTVGAWLAANGEAVYGEKAIVGTTFRGCGVNMVSASPDHNEIYLWNRIWMPGGKLQLGGYKKAPKSVTFLATGEKIDFEMDGHRLILKNLPEEAPDKIAGITVIKLEFDGGDIYNYMSYYPHMRYGQNIAGDLVQ